ncbi:SAM-dependent methyltransferase [candidate division KSB1 bacterium]|nr:SAM-dependent methyltransferase [candidate division KSB1 bacterium]
MAFTLESVVPWGRNFDEYVAMFALSQEDLRKRIVGCGDGPACFNAMLAEQGGFIFSVDPIYQFSTVAIRTQIEVTYPIVIEQTRAHSDIFIWGEYQSVEHLCKIRMDAMETFLNDFQCGYNKSRYIAACLPDLPFSQNAFDLALCSHFLFLYSEHHSLDFHIQSIKELCRIASEVRIFPLQDLSAKKSDHLDNVIQQLQQENFLAQIIPVAYEFQKGINSYLSVKNQ